MKLSCAALSILISTNTEVGEWCRELNKLLPEYDITTPVRIAAFISQCAHESWDFTVLEENMNYPESSLGVTAFTRYFGPGKRDAKDYAGNPEKLANYVYMDEFRTSRGALGNTMPGDGWKFRGRGLKQLTGRWNYEAFARKYKKSLNEAIEWLSTKEGALTSALWFWETNDLNHVADTGDVSALTRKINGGINGLPDRRSRFLQAIGVLTGGITADNAPSAPLKRGSRGPEVRKLQEKLGLNADGRFGPATEAAVKSWQSHNGLTADGVVGPITQTKLESLWLA